MVKAARTIRVYIAEKLDHIKRLRFNVQLKKLRKRINRRITQQLTFYSANAVTANGPIYCIWETKEGISIEEFQEFIDGPTGPGFGLSALMNICKPIDTSLMNGQTPYPRVFT